MTKIERFLSYVNKLENGCWEWTGLFHRGRPEFLDEAGSHRYLAASHVSYRLFINTSINNFDQIKYKCKNSLCLNPEHMTLNKFICSIDGCKKVQWSKSYCHFHYQRVKRGILNLPEQASIQKYKQELLLQGNFICSTCKLIKIKDDFAPNKKTKFKLDSQCLLCRKNTQKITKSYILKTYNLSPEDHQKLWDSQNGKCAICKKDYSLFKKGLGVDHNHKTNKIRGLLCGKCNTGLGQFNEDPILLNEAINYIKYYTKEKI